MTDSAPQAGRWGHSFEEDTPGVRVYRLPGPGFAFPRARGRGALELHEDGTWVELSPGAADAPTPAARGRWTATDDGVVLEGEDGRRRRAVLAPAAGRADADVADAAPAGADPAGAAWNDAAPNDAAPIDAGPQGAGHGDRLEVHLDEGGIP